MTFDRDEGLSDDRVNIVMFESYVQTMVLTTRPSHCPVVMSTTVAFQLFRNPNLTGPLWVATLLFLGSVSLLVSLFIVFPTNAVKSSESCKVASVIEEKNERRFSFVKSSL